MTRTTRIAALMAVVVGAILAITTTGAFAGKPTSATLSLSFSTGLALTSTSSVPYGTPYVVSGCGYDAGNGGVTVIVHSPEAISWAGQVPDSNGCISLTNFSTQGAGSYEVDAYQTIHNKSTLMASTTVGLN